MMYIICIAQDIHRKIEWILLFDMKIKTLSWYKGTKLYSFPSITLHNDDNNENQSAMFKDEKSKNKSEKYEFFSKITNSDGEYW